jgi:hypothetical protein
MAFVAPNDPVGKGPVTVCLDRMSTGVNARAKLQLLKEKIFELAPDFPGLEGVFQQYLLPEIYSPAESTAIANYLKQYWFDEATGWWPTFQPIAPIYAMGVTQTINASLNVSPAASPQASAASPEALRRGERGPLPINSYWILNHQHVEMINLASPIQVTLLICTPPPPELGPSGIQGLESQVWVSSRRAGRTAGEIDHQGMMVNGDAGLRVRTFKIETRAGKRPPGAGQATGTA